MSGHMRAVVKSRPGPGIDILDRPVPVRVRPGDVLIRVGACGVCGSDLQYYRWNEHLASELTLPRILGHEIAGEIAEIGEAVTGYRPGDRVVAESWARCGECHFCRVGRSNHCVNLERLGHTVDGGMASHVVLPATSLHRLPPQIPFAEAATLKPLGVALHAFERLRVTAGDYVAVIGPGTVGLLAARLAELSGASRVIVLGLAADRRRLELAESWGYTTIEVDDGDVVARVLDATDGLGPETVLEASGGAGTLSLAVALARQGGEIGVVGLAKREEFDPSSLVLKELRIVGSLTRLPSSWIRAIRLVAEGKVNLGALVTHRFSVDDALEAFRVLESGEAIKAIIEPAP